MAPGGEHLRAGRQGEKTARRFLLNQGLRLLHSNYRCRYGELDLVMLDGQCLVVVEVRFRSSCRVVGPLESVGAAKQQRLGRSTLHYLQHHRQLQNLPLRFDVLALTGDGDAPAVDWVKNAFQFDSVC